MSDTLGPPRAHACGQLRQGGWVVATHPSVTRYAVARTAVFQGAEAFVLLLLKFTGNRSNTNPERNA